MGEAMLSFSEANKLPDLLQIYAKLPWKVLQNIGKVWQQQKKQPKMCVCVGGGTTRLCGLLSPTKRQIRWSRTTCLKTNKQAKPQAKHSGFQWIRRSDHPNRWVIWAKKEKQQTNKKIRKSTNKQNQIWKASTTKIYERQRTSKTKGSDHPSRWVISAKKEKQQTNKKMWKKTTKVKLGALTTQAGG